MLLGVFEGELFMVASSQASSKPVGPRALQLTLVPGVGVLMNRMFAQPIPQMQCALLSLSCGRFLEFR